MPALPRSNETLSLPGCVLKLKMDSGAFQRRRNNMRQQVRRFERRVTEVYVYPEICKHQDAISDVQDYMKFLESEPGSGGFMIYVHIPFCEALCYFCNYYKVLIRKDA